MIEKKEITIVIADDHPMLLKGLYEELIENGYNVVGKANNGAKALELILKLKPNIALLDIEMPFLTGFEVIKKAKQKNIDTKFIVLSFHKENDYISQAKTLQINGYLLKEDSFIEIENCMNLVMNNKICFSHSFEPNSLQNVSRKLEKIYKLTSSEKTILKFIVKQMTSNEIAETLFISARTVEKHRSNIITKLDLENNTNALTNWALLNKNVINEL